VGTRGRRLISAAESQAVNIVVGGLPIRLSCRDYNFAALLRGHYDGFCEDERSEHPPIELAIRLGPRPPVTGDDELRVRLDAGNWILERGDFRCTYDPRLRRGEIHQSPNRYSVDSVLRILHSLALVPESGFLLHASSGIRNGRAYIFAGRSGAGKTTMARLAPPGVTLLTDEISYIRRAQATYFACGTPFWGELAKAGENHSGLIQALCFLEHAPENRLTPLSGAESLRSLLQNILFFAQDPALVARVFENACDFVSNIPIYRLSFRPEASVWELFP
jgi:hypothetical protein